MLRVTLLLVCAVYMFGYAASVDCNNFEKCSERTHLSCEECIRIHPCCNWCSEIDFDQPRCNTKQNLLLGKCGKLHITHGGNSNITRKVAKAFQNVDEAKNQPAVQIKPKEIDLRLRMNEPITFQLQYKAVPNYPLDLYYLMDLTYSMKPDLKTMLALGSKLSDTLQALTKTYRIAFGYYSDKVALPFAMMNDKYLQDPCQALEKTCAKGFDFIHALNFTGSVQKFIEKLEKSNVTANLDNLEGGFDAVMQVLACHEYMHWRKFSRKIIVVASGGLMHLAGDGILAGAIHKHPGTCLLDEDGTYTKHSLLYDYPSLEEINNKLLTEKVNILFAAKKEAFQYYSSLQETIPEASMVGELDSESLNILNLVKSSYQKVVRNVKFQANQSDYIKVTFKSTCNDRNNVMLERSQCKNVVIGEVYTFNVTLELIKLPVDTNETFVIEELNIFEPVKVNVEYIGVRCNCSESGTKECPNGQFRCGKCNCNPGWTGSSCDIECKENACKFHNGTYVSATCFGNGDCDLATCSCRCDRQYAGEYCEYNQCPWTKYGICNGKGICDKGICICQNDYSKEDCSCYTKSDTCTAPGQNKICNGAGTCNCGTCECIKGYSGIFCEYCASCNAVCSDYEDCIKGVTTNQTTDHCTQDKNEFYTMQNDTVQGLCLARFYNDLNEWCEVKYDYKYEKQEIFLIYENAHCYRPVSAGMKVGGVIAAILVLGLMVILFIKMTNVFKDKREFAQFEKERLLNMEMRGENPLYKSPITQFRNPMLETEGVGKMDD